MSDFRVGRMWWSNAVSLPRVSLNVRFYVSTAAGGSVIKHFAPFQNLQRPHFQTQSRPCNKKESRCGKYFLRRHLNVKSQVSGTFWVLLTLGWRCDFYDLYNAETVGMSKEITSQAIKFFSHVSYPFYITFVAFSVYLHQTFHTYDSKHSRLQPNFFFSVNKIFGFMRPTKYTLLQITEKISVFGAPANSRSCCALFNVHNT
jgi:hypothetical protein